MFRVVPKSRRGLSWPTGPPRKPNAFNGIGLKLENPKKRIRFSGNQLNFKRLIFLRWQIVVLDANRHPLLL